MNKTILLVDDDQRLRDLLKDYLSEKKLSIFTSQDFEEAKEILKYFVFDLIILDRMMPSGDGVELISLIKNKSNTPIIMLTARGEEHDRIKGLEMGADDYVTKPFSINELLARAKAVIKRTRPIFAEEKVTFEDISLDIATHKVFRKDKEIKLGPTEFNLLRFFLENKNRVFSREQLLNHVWRHDALVEPRTVDVHVRRLRKVLNANDKNDYIRTVRSAGYSFGHN